MCFDNLKCLPTHKSTSEISKNNMHVGIFSFGLMVLRNASLIIIIFNLNLFIEFDTVEFKCQQVVFSGCLQNTIHSCLFLALPLIRISNSTDNEVSRRSP